MRRHAGAVLITALIAGAVALLVFAFINHAQHVKACKKSGGHVEQRYEGTSVSYSYTYDSKGNVTSVTPVITQEYSYHCWVTGRETDSW